MDTTGHWREDGGVERAAVEGVQREAVAQAERVSACLGRRTEYMNSSSEVTREYAGTCSFSGCIYMQIVNAPFRRETWPPAEEATPASES